MSGSASSTSSTARIVEKECRSSAEARMTSTPPGQRARSCLSAATRSGVELVTRDQLVELVDGLLLLVKIAIRLRGDLLLLVVVERAAGILLEDLVPDGLRRVRLLAAHLPRVEREDVLLDGQARDHSVREPSKVAALIGGVAVLAVLLDDGREVLAIVDRLLDVGELLQLIAERLEVAAAHLRRRDRDPCEVDLLRRRLHARGLRLLGVRVLQDVVADVRLDVGLAVAVRRRALDEHAVARRTELEQLDDVVAVLALDGLRDLAHLHRVHRDLVLLHELALGDEAEMATRVLRAWIVGVL